MDIVFKIGLNTLVAQMLFFKSKIVEGVNFYVNKLIKAEAESFLESFFLDYPIYPQTRVSSFPGFISVARYIIN